MEAFLGTITQAETEHQFDQLVIVGSVNDIAWMHSSLPPTTAQHITAEIANPLNAEWFREPAPLQTLSSTLERLFNA